eukprot:COSAG02_NODE_1388_length_12920_cov_8.638122_1_plen_60_part_10
MLNDYFSLYRQGMIVARSRGGRGVVACDGRDPPVRVVARRDGRASRAPGLCSFAGVPTLL